MQIKHTFINVNTNEKVEHLPHGEYQVIGDPILIVRPARDESGHDGTEYEFIHRVGRIS